MAAPRPLAVRKQDTLDRIDQDVDAWVATASLDGTPYLMPLSFLWDGRTLLLSTAVNNPTARNLRANPLVQLTIGQTRDVVHIIATTEELATVPAAEGDAFAAKAGFDPRQASTPYPFIRATPTTIQAWREGNEIKGRLLMRSGTWLV